MPNTEIYLIRHGLPQYQLDSEGRKLMYGPEANLSDEGRAQALSLSKKLPALDVIYTSPYTRARETAEIIARELGVTSVVESGSLSDRYSINWQGRLLQDVLEEKIESHPNDETVEEAYYRVTNGFRDILKKEKGKKVGVVFHGDPIRFIVWEHVEKGEPIKEFNPDLKSSNYPLQGEAWVFVFNEAGELINYHLITRDDNQEPGVGKW